MPPQACHITTPLIPPAWCCLLFSHPDRALVRFFIEGITQGFRIGHCPSLSLLKSARKKMKSALLHEDVIDDYLATEVREQRVVGPLPLHDYGLKEVHINRFGVKPKAHQPDKWRLIVDLSHPKEASVNSGIIKQLCSMSYTTVDNATQKVISLGPGTHLAKIDINSAFRLIPVHPADRHLLAMKWRDAIYIDTCLPFGLRSAPKIFNVLADLLEWILLNQGVSFIMHYLDDYLTIGPPNSPITIMAKELLPIVISCAVWGPILSRRSVKFQCDNMGVVKAVEKGSSKELVVPHLLRLMWFFVAHYDIDIHIEHIAGAENIAADNLSRNMMLQFFSSNPQADCLPTPLPQELIRIVSVAPPDWTSPLFSQLFNTIISKV